MSSSPSPTWSLHAHDGYSLRGAAIANRVELVQHVENPLILGGVLGVAKVLIGGKGLLHALEGVVLWATGRTIGADQCAGRARRSGDELAVDDPIMLGVERVGKHRGRKQTQAVLLRQSPRCDELPFKLRLLLIRQMMDVVLTGDLLQRLRLGRVRWCGAFAAARVRRRRGAREAAARRTARRLLRLLADQGGNDVGGKPRAGFETR